MTHSGKQQGQAQVLRAAGAGTGQLLGRARHSYRTSLCSTGLWVRALPFLGLSFSRVTLFRHTGNTNALLLFL